MSEVSNNIRYNKAKAIFGFSSEDHIGKIILHAEQLRCLIPCAIDQVDIHEIKGLRNYGIMSPAPWSGAYQSFLNSLPPNPPNNTLTSLLVDEQTQLALVPARTSTMESFSTSLSLLTVAIVSSNVPYVDDFSTNRVTTCTNSLYSFGFQTLMDPLSNYLFFLYVAFASTFVCCCYFALSLVIFVSLTTCNLVFIG
ncbi:unnamed protein product [Arabidopsis thaliana]|uniref:Transmembrane protein n=1 Tax=Arabidopsis thaliana TaxID=3702 RepID=A0A5S9WY52_ARATH|nr:unnamed protein product [Arabidopsis thaliana]VYS52420.1 unnamed protein product [Arabidopsis thaliana]